MPPISFFFASADPILSGGALSSQWVMIIMGAVIGYFLVRTLNRFDDDLKSLNATVNKIMLSQKEQETTMKSMEEKVDKVDPEKIAEIAMAKILAAGGGTGGRHWPFKNERHGDD